MPVCVASYNVETGRQIPITAEGEHITFCLDSTPTLCKTQTWVVKSKYEGPDARLGVIKWFGRWRKYSFFPADGCIFEEVCLRDIGEFIVDRTKEHKAKGV